MRQLTAAMCSALALAMTAGTVLPAAAAPAIMPQAPAASGLEAIQVQSRADRRENRRENRVERRQERRENRVERRQDRREARFERRNGIPYYGRYRGYRDYRPGYRRYNGFYFPPGAFIAGAIIGGAIASQPAVRASGSSHVQWCYDRWRSYRDYDNTYQPTSGPRRSCISPYS